jgi:prepilin-type N-terminal cleavage/methylation domain-containing protein/prepilin-type processing-associated H-X9-DG protein
MRHHRAFTLVELVVVIVVITVLAGVLFPAIQAARSSARRLQCTNKMKQIGLAIHNYNAQYNQFPPSKWGIEDKDDSRTKHHVLTFLLPYLEQQPIYQQFDFQYNWNDNIHSKNKEAAQNHLSLFHCPNAPRHHFFKKEEHFVSDYAVAESMLRTEELQRANADGEVIGHPIKPLFTNHVISAREGTEMLHGMLQPASIKKNGKTILYIITETSIGDGLSNTLMFEECSGRPMLYRNKEQLVLPATLEKENTGSDWANNQSPFYIRSTCGTNDMQLFNCNNKEIYSFHSGGANFLYGDAAVRFHSEGIHPEIFISLFTAHAGDTATSP